MRPMGRSCGSVMGILPGEVVDRRSTTRYFRLLQALSNAASRTVPSTAKVRTDSFRPTSIRLDYPCLPRLHRTLDSGCLSACISRHSFIFCTGVVPKRRHAQRWEYVRSFASRIAALCLEKSLSQNFAIRFEILHGCFSCDNDGCIFHASSENAAC